jgi:TIR domain
MTLEQRGAADTAESGVVKSKAAFLSHSSEDHKLAEELCASLEARGLACWIAPRDIATGQPWALGCLQGVAESSSLLLLASESALVSVQVLSEVEQAHKRAKPIYTVLIPPVKVRGEMDFYISRLHWLESNGRITEDIVAKVAQVLAGHGEWRAVAPRPTLRRMMQYRPVAFAKMVAATVVGLVLVLSGLLFVWNRKLNMGYLHLGYVDLVTGSTDNGRATGRLTVWGMADGVPFSDMRLLTAIKTADGHVSRKQYANWPVPQRVGSQEMLPISLEPEAEQMTTCLVVPSPGLHGLYRVTQQFLLTRQYDWIRVSETAEKRVSKEDNSPCG